MMAFQGRFRTLYYHRLLLGRARACVASVHIGRRTYHGAPPCHLSSSAPTKNNNEGPRSVVLYDSLSESYKTLPSSTDSNNKGLAFYTCGPTTYAPAHLGHARTYVCLDILRRILEHHHKSLGSGMLQRPPPIFVMNITDVDDKILAAATENGEEPLDLARRYEKDFWNDWDALGCLRPHVVTRVTEHVESDIISYIERLVEQGMAYMIDDDGVYFDVRAFDDKMGHLTKYGKLAPPSTSSDFFSTHRLKTTKKRDARDFVLWKYRKPQENLYWDAPWGQGRPGWHIECSAMIESVQKQFQDTHVFQIHAGGVDLKFPHHTNEIAQAEAYNRLNKGGRKEWIPHWIHTGHLHIHGMKMSKSLKNFITIQEMLSEDSGSSDGILSSPADDFRLWCLGLSGSYRGAATYSKERLNEAKAIRARIVRFLLDGESWIQQADESAPKEWNRNDHLLFTLVMTALANCHHAMIGSSSRGNRNPTKEFDMDGSTFVEELLVVVDAGMTHMRKFSDRGMPVEPIRAAVDAIRDLLSMVGFSDTTVRIGLDQSHGEHQKSHVVGGEVALIEEIVRFRSAVRKAALCDVREKTASENVEEILKLCDNSRRDVFPSMGLEIFDSKAEEDTSSWRFIVPKPNVEHGDPCPSKTGRNDNPETPLHDIPLEDLFRAGRYEGMFSEFNEDGIPVENSDGTEVSKRLLKKLMKKRDKHERRQKTCTKTRKK